MRRTPLSLLLLAAAACTLAGCNDDQTVELDGHDDATDMLADTALDTTEPDVPDTAVDTVDTTDTAQDTDTAPCGAPECTAEGRRCVDDAVQICALDANGCFALTTLDCASNGGGFCDDTLDPPDCVPGPCADVTDPCDAAATTCDGDTRVTCAPNTDGCLVETRTDCAAMPGGACQDDDCTVDPCAAVANPCTVQGTTCSADTLETCAPDANGCLELTPTDCADGAGGFCNPDAPAACDVDPCFDVVSCPTEGTTCNADTLEICAANADGCLELTALDCADTGELCDANGGAAPRCVPACQPIVLAGDTWSTTTLAAGDDATPDCAAPGAEDVAAVWTAPSSGCATLEVTSAAGGYDPVLAVRESCTGAFLACDDNAASAVRPRVELDVVAGTDYVLWLDGAAAGQAGTATVEVTVSPVPCIETACADTLDEDQDGLVDCLDPDCFGLAACTTETDCHDGLDNDADGAIDCLDTECASAPGCVCGDGAVAPLTESCDDGNLVAGDGCSPTCTIEGESCATPLLVPPEGLRVTGAQWSRVLNDLDPQGVGCGSSSGEPELVFQVDVLAGQGVDVRELEPGFLQRIRILEGSCTAATDCAAATLGDTLQVLSPVDQSLFVVVEAPAFETDRPIIDIRILSPTCGNLVVEPGEQCDDGDVVPGDGCGTDCQIEDGTCANPIVVGSSGLRMRGASWAAFGDDLNLHAATCDARPAGHREVVFRVDLLAGQGVRVNEHSDTNVVSSILAEGTCGPTTPCVASQDGPELAGPTYLAPVDESVYVVVEADLGSASSSFDIEIDVRPPACGNGALDPGELCDDGNAVGGDGCSASCGIEGQSCADPIVITTDSFRWTGPDFNSISDSLLLDAGTCSSQPGAAELVLQLDLAPGQAVRAAELTPSFAVVSILPGGCGAAVPCSTSSGDYAPAEYVSMTGETVFVVVEGQNVTKPFDIRVERFTAEVCTDTVDNDDDGLVDCDDPHCFGTASCATELNCADGLDNDDDGDPDCLDPDCIGQFGCLCGDGVVGIGEGCEDGNAVPGDGCSPSCQLEYESCADDFLLPLGRSRFTGSNWEDHTIDDLTLDVTCQQPSNNGATGDLVFRADLLAGYTLIAEEVDHGFAGQLSLLPGLCSATATCLRSVFEGIASDELRLEHTATTDQTVFLVMEGATNATSNAWDLHVTIAGPENCATPEVDDDLDGLLGCDDPDCAASACVVEPNCLDDLDNDADGLTDCDDLDCLDSHACRNATGVFEAFSIVHPIDLVGQRLTFAPGGPGIYTWTATPVTALDTSPGSGTVSRELDLWFNDVAPWTLSLSGGLPFYDRTYRTVFVSANGFLTFGASDASDNDTDAEFFEHARISALDTRFNPLGGARGQIIVDELADALVVTWLGMDLDGTGAIEQDTAQLRISTTTGQIELTILSATPSATYRVGLSSGGPLSPQVPLPVDLVF